MQTILTEGYETLVYDRLETGMKKSKKQDNFEKALYKLSVENGVTIYLSWTR